jgi:phosphonate degradation associated HDIG domain protein
MTDEPNRLPKDLPAVIDRICELFQERGSERYGGEDVSQTEHALQSAMAAEKEGAPPALVVSALLHDLGHLLHNLPDDCAEHGVDDRHEDLACRWLQRYFGPEVTEPIRLHVSAKRYLCATDHAYHAGLSDASRLSLKLQGGPFQASEVADFEKNPHFRSAVQVRVWDDIAKIKGLATPTIDHYRPMMEATGKTL